MGRKSIVIPKFSWRSLDPAIEAHVSRVLENWIGTPYRDGQQVPGVGTDCVRFVTGCIDQLQGREIQPIPKLPNDASLHNREAAMRVMRIIISLYEPLEEVKDGTLEPGDIIIVGPPKGGPGHAMFVGVRKNTLCQATQHGVQLCGLAFPIQYCKLFHIFRCIQKAQWVS